MADSQPQGEFAIPETEPDAFAKQDGFFIPEEELAGMAETQPAEEPPVPQPEPVLLSDMQQRAPMAAAPNPEPISGHNTMMLAADAQPAQTLKADTAKFTPFDEEEQNYAMRVKRELEAMRKKSVPVDPNATLPTLPPEPKPEKPKKPRKDKAPKEKPVKEASAKEDTKSRKRTKPDAEKSRSHEDREEMEMRRRAKETPEEKKARQRASLLDDLPDLPEDREKKLRAKETPEETKARKRRELLDDLPDLPDEPVQRPNPKTAQAPTAEGEISPENDPFADIHWNEDQSTFTIRF